MRHILALLLATLSFPLSAAITGTVMTGDGQPVSGARVMIHAIETPEGRRQRLLSASPDFVALASTQTDAKGAFTLESPKEAVVDLRVELRGYEPVSRRIERDEEVGAIAVAKRELTRGTVTAGGKPVANALVVVSYSGDFITRTDEQGRYETTDFKRARGIAVIHPDYAIDEELFVNPSTPASEANRTLSAGVALAGRAVAADNTTPVAKATIVVDNWPLATSGDDGAFTIAHAPAKWSTVVARNETLTGTRAAPANNKALTVRLEKSAVVTGRVTDAKSKLPIAGATVRLGTPRRPSAGEISLLGLTDAKGAYSILTPPGQYMITASHPAYEIQAAEANVAAGQQLVKDIAVAQLARVSGVVVDEEKRPVVAASVSSEAAGGEMAMMRMPLRMMRGDGGTISGPDGRFSVRVSAESDLRLKASKKGMPHAKGDPFRLAAGERKGSVVLTIPTGIAVSGRVLDPNGDPLSGVSVSATETPAGRDGGMMVRRMIFTGMPADEEDLVRSSSDGTFTLRVKEGTYDFTFRREGYSEKVVRAQPVAASGAPNIETRLEPAVEISGRVVRGGSGVPDVTVSAFTGTEAMTTTGPDGSFTLSGLTPGIMRLMIAKPQELVQEQRNITAPGRDVLIELPQGATISGRVVEKGTKKPVTTFSAGVTTSRGGGSMMMIGPPMTKQFTSDDGSFTLEHVPSGAISLVANAPGFTSARLNLDLEEGKGRNDIVLELEQGARLTGRVTGANGSPLADVAVSIEPSFSGGFTTRGSVSRTTTDASGEYTLDSVEPGEETVLFSHPKHVSLSKKVTIKGRDTRLDVQMSGGQHVTGVVVTESGAPVPDAEVQAWGAGNTKEARTNASGTFEMESMAPGRYRFTAARSGFAQGRVDDFDVSGGTPLRIVLGTGGTIYGRVTGLAESELAHTTVNAYSTGGRGSGSSGAVDPQGNFRIDGVPEGTVRVAAQVSSSGGFGTARSSPTQTIEMTPGGSQQVNLEFRTDTVIRGRITRNGAPVTAATVQFFPRGGGATSNATATADEQGSYSVSGLEPGEYSVMVRDQRLSPYSTTYTVRGSATFDIEYKTGIVRGRVLNALSNDPIANAAVSLKPTTGDMRLSGFSGSTDSAGTFAIDSVPPGTYRVLVTGEGFANHSAETTVSEQGRENLEFRLTRNDGVRLRVVDARDGRTLNAIVSAYDLQGRTAHEMSMMRFGGGAEEEQTIQLPPGPYVATVTVSGGSYAPMHVRLSSPGSETVRMSPGGTIRMTSKHAERRKFWLRDATGTPYPRWTERTIPRDLPPGASTLERIAPGTYTIQLLNESEMVVDQLQVTVREAETVDVSI